jgi:hypothetical protein
MSYIPARERNGHRQQHLQEQINIERQPYCSTCYPRPEARLISREFRRFWTWISLNHNATFFTGFTTAAFATIRSEYRNDHPTLTVDHLAALTIALASSIGYNLPLTPLTELCFYIHYLFERTQLFDNTVRPNDQLAVANAYRRSEDNQPPANQPVPQPMDQNQLNQTLTAVLGQGGLNIATLAQNLQQAVQALNNAPQAQQQPRELTLVKLNDFHGKEEEDPHEWIEQFEQAAAANRWTGNDRLIAIVKGYLKGAASDWAIAATDANAQQRIQHWNDNNHAQTSFVPRFLAKFAPETKQNR